MRIVLTRREALDSPDGVSIFIVSLAQAFRDLGHQVKIVTGSLHSPAKYQRLLCPRLDVPIIGLSSARPTRLASAATWLRGKRVIDGFAPNLVIHSEAIPIPLRGEIVQVVHDLEPRTGRLAPLWRMIRRFSTWRSDHVVATTSELRKELVRDLGMPADRIALIPKCIDRLVYRMPDLSHRQRAILHAGTSPYKRPEVTIRAFGALNDTSIDLFVSGQITKPVKEAFESLPARLRSHVALLGEADGRTVRSLHGEVRIAAFPTRYAIPVASATVMEAVASATPIVGSPRLSRDVLADNMNGLTTEPEPAAMASAMRRLLDDDILWLRLSKGAARMVERFDALRVAAQYIALAPVNGFGTPIPPIEDPQTRAGVRRAADEESDKFAEVMTGASDRKQ